MRCSRTNVYLDRVPPQDQHDSTASITDISVFAQCPRKYLLVPIYRLGCRAAHVRQH